MLARDKYLLEVVVRTVVEVYPKDLASAKQEFQDAPIGMFVGDPSDIKVVRLGVQDFSYKRGR